MKLLLWPGMLLVLVNIVLLAKKNRAGFMAGIAANVLFAVFNVHVALWPYVICNVVFITANVHGWRSWRRKLVKKLLQYHEHLDIGVNLPSSGYMIVVREIDRAGQLTETEVSDIISCLMEKLIEKQGWSTDKAGTLIAGRVFEEASK